jgi:hypothetical protein
MPLFPMAVPAPPEPAAPAPAAPEAAAPPPSPPVKQPSPPAAPPKRSRRGVIVGIVLVLVAVNGLLLAHRNGLLRFPDLTSGGDDKKPDGPQAKKSEGPSVQQAKNSAKPKVDNGNPNPKKENPNAGQANGVKGNPDKNSEVNPGANEGNPSKDNPGGAKIGNVGVKPAVNGPPPPPPPQPRPFKGTDDVLAAVQDHLLKLPEGDRRFQRFFSLAHLSNNKALTDKQLDQYRDALTALVRHLQPAKETKGIVPIDKAKVVLCLDLRAFGWEQYETWREVLKCYPHLLLHGGAKDDEVAALAKEVTALSDCDMPVVHLDWFLYAAGRSSLREKLGPDAGAPVPDAVAALYPRYLEKVALEQAARELGLVDAKELRAAVQASPRLRELGLETLLNGGALSRQEWTSLARTFSPSQEAAQQLGLGTPYRVD